MSLYKANPRDYYDFWYTIDTKYHLIERDKETVGWMVGRYGQSLRSVVRDDDRSVMTVGRYIRS